VRVPAMNLNLGVAALNRFHGSLIALREMLLDEKMTQYPQSVWIRLVVHTFLDGDNDLVVIMSEPQRLPPAMDLIEGFDVTHERASAVEITVINLSALSAPYAHPSRSSNKSRTNITARPRGGGTAQSPQCVGAGFFSKM